MSTEKIFFNGNIFTQDKLNPRGSAFAVSKGRIIAVGNDDEILSLKNSSTEVLNLQNKTVLPGFNDAHIHLWKVGDLMIFMLDLRGVKSIRQMQQMISDFAKRNPGNEWIVARGFNEALLEEKRFPSRKDLDEAVSDKPVCIIRTCAHQIVVNSKALQVSGITEITAAPQGGQIFFENGHFTETAIGLAMNKIPKPSAAKYREMILAALEEFLKYGITSATDPAVMPDLLAVYKAMEKRGELKIRVNAIPIVWPDGANEALPIPEKYSSDFLNVNTVKFFADGGISGKTAALKKFYRNTTENGVLRLEEKQFYHFASAQKKGFQIATHAIGDAAIDLVLDVYEKLFSEGTLLHHRIEHFGLPSEKNLEQMKRMNISAVMQPVFIRELGQNFREYLDEDYLSYLYPCKSVLKYGINLSLSTDAPVVRNFTPLSNIQDALERKDIGGIVIGDSEKISIEEALYAYTMGSAIANDDKTNVGSISKNKFANFVVLSQNPFLVTPEKISSIQVEATFVNGECLYPKN